MFKKMRKLIPLVLATVLVFPVWTPNVSAAEKGSAKNVILLIPDGMGASYLTASRIFKGEELGFERYLKGMLKTDSANTSVTDSAAAGTAMATGYKTDNGKISISPNGAEPDSILDAARNKDKATGLVATSRITHATPAVFVAHDASRGNEVALAQQYIGNVDVILGGGRDMFTHEDDGGKQPELDLVTEAENAGYEYITNKSEMANIQGDKVLGLFADEALTYEMDRVDPTQPSLSEMTSTAIDILNKDEDGFFLMVEGSQIDWAGHANDPAAAITDTLEFEKAVNEAVEFAREDDETLVVVVGDHETGGMVIGTTAGGYADNISILKNVTASNNIVASELEENARTISLSNGVEVDGDYYMHIRDIVNQLGATFNYNSKSKKAVIKYGMESVTIDLGKKEMDKGQPFDMYFDKEKKQNYLNVESLVKLFGYNLAISSTKNEPKNTKGYLVDINEIVSPFWGFDLTEEDENMIASVNWNNQTNVINVLGTVISNHAYISWGTRNHSGVEVPLYAYGQGADEFVGLLDNTDLPRIITYLMGTELFADEETFMNQLEERRTN
ncbi:alkaline phosphatase [Halalkalibacter nanhaiisediminis]|uniref:Alkaline phosphatase n=1 Tax=Halalkalibacter nanhaiisediminis TaxID=688079 RepID=A0A562Q991_9BACI|nr:alkaline phosphatase [Halalkalibacter nanhaiisediminis]TWI53322.1 alkaline phosphatase [Halalkalibacter nanhaiisediminis]